MDEDIEKLSEENGGYWGSHPRFPTSDWQYEAANGDTRLGYWEWVEKKLAHDD